MKGVTMRLFNKNNESETEHSGFAVLGLGLFGSALARSLADSGEDVIVMDTKSHLIEDIAGSVTRAVRADATDIEALREAGIAAVRTAIITMGNNLEASVLAVMNLRELGVPYIMAKANNESYAAVLKKLGVDELVSPEAEMGTRVAEKLVNPTMTDLVSLSRNCIITELKAPKLWQGHCLKDLGLRSKYGLNVIGLKDEKTGHVNIHVDPEHIFNENDLLVLIGDKKSLNKLELST
jgi:trk system potassium uptake protein TrkA